MSKIFTPGAGILFIKVGTHAQETLDAIIERKLEEIERTGMSFWGYGGNTCHPTSMVQPFAKELSAQGPIHVCMETMVSNHFGVPESAAEYSADGDKWEFVPPEIDVRGSRYALVIKNLKEDRFSLPLGQTRVPVGPSSGRFGSRYVQGKVDKACLEVLPKSSVPPDVERNDRPISYVAELVEPYAVFLRNFRQ